MPTKNAAMGGQKKKLTAEEKEMLKKPVQEKKEKNTGKKVAIVVASALLAATTLTIPAVIYYTNHQDFQVEIHAVGEDLSSNQTLKLKKGSTIGDIQAPNKDGYFFAGFYSDQDLNNELSTDTKITKGTTVYLKYIIINYVFTNADVFENVEIQNLTGEKLDTTQPLHHGDRFAVKLTTKTGYDSTFSITGAEFTDEYTETGLPIYKIVADNKTAEDKDITLHYEEQIQTFIVHFFNEEGVEQTSQSVQYNNSITVDTPHKDPTTEEQFSFAGWLIVDENNEQLGEEKQYFNFGETPITANLYVRADFTSSPREYTLTIDAEDQSHVKIERKVKDEDRFEDITAQTEIHYGDILKISYTLSDNADLVTFKINDDDYSTTEPSEEITLTVEGNLTIDFEEEIIEVLEYKLNSNKDGYIVNGLKADATDVTEIVIPDMYMGLPVTEIRDFAFSRNPTITSVTIGKNVTAVGESAFWKCPNMKSVTLGKNVTTIGIDPFEGCTNLTKINYTDTLKEWCESSITGLNNLLKELGRDLFINGQQIKGELIIPDDVTKINDYAFRYIDDITSVKIGKNVTTIGAHAFQYCYGLIKVTISENVTNIGTQAFTSCYKLVEVINKSSSLQIAKNTSNGYIGYYTKQIVNEESQSKIKIEDGVYYYEDGKNYIALGFADDTKTSITFPEKTTEIYKYAFYSCNVLTEITIPQNVTQIGKSAFSNTGLINVDLSNATSLKTIEEYAFSGSNLEKITLPPNLSQIGDYALSSIEEVIIPKNIPPIDSCSVRVFSDSGKAIKLNYLGTLKEWCESSCGLKKANKKHGTELYIDGKKIEGELVIPDDVSEVHGDFSYIDDITCVTFGKNLTYVGDCFSNCAGLTKINYTGTLKEWCESSITWLDALLKLGRDLFINGQQIKGELIIPDDVTKINNYAFYHIDDITSVTIGENVEAIRNYVFHECKNLDLVTIKSKNIYEAIRHSSGPGELITYATKVRVLKTIVTSTSNSYLNGDKWTRTDDADPLYYLFTKN